MQRISKRRTGGFIYPTRKTRTYSYRKPKNGKTKTRKNKLTKSKMNKSVSKTF